MLEAEHYFLDLQNILDDHIYARTCYHKGVIIGYYGYSLFRYGKLEQAKSLFLTSLQIKRKEGDVLGIPETICWLGEVHEMLAKRHKKKIELDNAESYYLNRIGKVWGDRPYFECKALIGLVRIKYAKGEIFNISQLIDEAEKIACTYEYNNQLASLRLVQGYLAKENSNLAEAIEYGSG